MARYTTQQVRQMETRAWANTIVDQMNDDDRRGFDSKREQWADGLSQIGPWGDVDLTDLLDEISALINAC
jgi:hypothetical protein